MLDRRVHRWFARYWNWPLRSENAQIKAMRRDTAGGTRGRVLEVGCGSGGNFEYYGHAVLHRRLLGAGCHLNRKTGDLVQEAGFSSVEIERLNPLPVFPMGLYRPHVKGVARR